MTTTYGALVGAWLSDPGPDTLTRLRRAIRRAGNFDPELRRHQEVDALLLARDWDAAIDALTATLPGALLSPSTHARLATALHRAGRDHEAERHARISQAAIESILSTGDGSTGRPWTVLRVADQDDVVAWKGLRPVSRSQVPLAARTLDRITTADGRTLHFEVAQRFEVPGT